MLQLPDQIVNPGHMHPAAGKMGDIVLFEAANGPGHGYGRGRFGLCLSALSGRRNPATLLHLFGGLGEINQLGRFWLSDDFLILSKQLLDLDVVLAETSCPSCCLHRRR